MKFSLLAFTFLTLVSPSSWAELGAASISFNVNAQIRTTSNLSSPKPTLYTIKKITTLEDIEIREYANLNGTVFGIYWVGDTKPDMSLLLGTYASRYNTLINQPLAGRSPVAINDSDLIIQTGGRMNNFFGVAFLPGIAPIGIQLAEIR